MLKDTDLEIFSRCPLFKSLSMHDISEVFQSGVIQVFSAGKIIFKLNDPGQSLYVILGGEIELLFPSDLITKKLRTGEIFGELALFSLSGLRTATARVSHDARLYILNKHAFELLANRKPKLIIDLLKTAVDYLLSSEQKLVMDLKQHNQKLMQSLDYLKRAHEELDHQELLMCTDPVTSLYNRRCFDKQLSKYILTAEQEGHNLALLLIDIDKFKEVNDTYGHPAGDMVLRYVAKALSRSVRQTDLPCRIGGDEFAIILPHIKAEGALKRALQICKTVAQEKIVLPDSGLDIYQSVSVGGCLWQTAQSPAELFKAADQNLYLAKNSGRNNVGWQQQVFPHDLSILPGDL